MTTVHVEVVREPNLLVQVFDENDRFLDEQMVPLVDSDATFDGNGLLERWKKSKEPYAPVVAAEIRRVLKKEDVLNEE